MSTRIVFFPLARSLRHLRERAGLSQPELAKILSDWAGKTITRSAISMWECGDRTPKAYTLVRIAEYFDVSVDAMFGRGFGETEGDLFLRKVFDC